MTYQSVNPATGILLQSFDDSSDAVLETKPAAANKKLVRTSSANAPA